MKYNLYALNFNTNPDKFTYRLIVIVFGLVMAMILVNIFSPLRLINDTVRYLRILDLLQGVIDKKSNAAHDVLPHGYSWFLYFLNTLHILNPKVITVINILSVLCSAVLAAKVLEIKNKLFYCTLILLSFINIKQYTLILSDQLFTVLFISSIYLWHNFFKGTLKYLIPALIVTGATIFIRTAGIALITGIVCYLIYTHRTRILKNKTLLITVVIVGVGFISFVAVYLSLFKHKIDYLRQLNLGEIKAHPFSIIDRFCIHLKEIGEIIINLPASKLSSAINVNGLNITDWLLVITGGAGLYLFGYVIYRLKMIGSFWFWAFLSYLLMIFLWPYYDTRFLIPVIPFIIYLVFYYLLSFIQLKYFKLAVLNVYLVLGIFSLIYSDAISLSHSFFLNHYGADQSLTNDYRIYFEPKKLNKNGKLVEGEDKSGRIYLLEKYGH